MDTEAAPEPWYPSAYAKETGITRESLDPYLDQLRFNLVGYGGTTLGNSFSIAF